MDQNEITTLKLMESLDREPKQTQRELAKELNISLGLVNSFIKRLVKKGIFKVKTIPKNRMKYVLTPKGMYEKTKLTYQYISYSLIYYRELRTIFKKMYERLSEKGKKRVLIFGTNELAEIALISLKETKLELKGIVDSEKAGSFVIGIRIMEHTSFFDTSIVDVAIVTQMISKVDDSFLKKFMKHTKIIDLRNEITFLP